MNEEQREVAERLIVRLDTAPAPLRDPDLNDDAAALLRELLAEPQGEPVLTLLEQSRQNCLRNFGPNGMADWIYNDLSELLANAAPQQPMRCPKDGGECGAGGYCRPQQRRPLSDAQILAALGIDGSDDWTFTVARAIERAHGITGEPT